MYKPQAVSLKIIVGEFKKELVLINPKFGNLIIRNAYLLLKKHFPPLSLLTLSALTPKEYGIKIYHLKTFWPKKLFKKNILVGITCFSSNAKLAYRLAEKYRRAGAYVVMGGPHASCLPQEALNYCHSVVIGEAESVWREVISDYETGRLKPIYTGEPLDDFISPAFEELKKLRPLSLLNNIQTARGCKNHCDFCVIPHKKLRFVKHEQVIELIKAIKAKIKKPKIIFRDDNIFSDPEYAKQLFRLLIPLKVKWMCLSSIDIAQDREALALARQSGCYQLGIGFETIYPERIYKSKRANILTQEDYLHSIKKIKSQGIDVRGAFIMGFDDDRIRDYFYLLIFLLKARLYSVALGILTPFPGTVLYHRLKKEGRIFDYNWDRYDCFHIVFRPKNMTALTLKLAFIFMRLITLFLGFETLMLIMTIILIIYHLISLSQF